MLDLPRLHAISLHTRPVGQVLVAELGLRWDYLLPRRTEIVLEGVENLPNRPVFLAMNHTDRYNYWPFQYAMYRRGLRFTATWVKGKYYENPWIARFMDAMNNIPLPSRGYVLTTLLRSAAGRKPAEAEYRWLRDLVDHGRVPEGPLPEGVRPALHRHGDGTPAGFLKSFDHLFGQMIERVVELNRQALHVADNNVLVFPQGTRSKRLSKGHTGLAQMAQHLGADVVPVGCNGSDRVYPGNSPLAKGGRIVYRIGKPLSLEGPELGPHRVREPFAPLSREATHLHGEAFRGWTDALMQRIEDLLDPEYRFAEAGRSDGVQGLDRFV